jgi:hypothetical protein
MTVSTSTVVNVHIQLVGDEARRIHKTAQQRGTTVDAVIEDAIRTYLAFDSESVEWSVGSLSSFQEGLDNDEDAIYDDWRRLYDTDKG